MRLSSGNRSICLIGTRVIAVPVDCNAAYMDSIFSPRRVTQLRFHRIVRVKSAPSARSQIFLLKLFGVFIRNVAADFEVQASWGGIQLQPSMLRELIGKHIKLSPDVKRKGGPSETYIPSCHREIQIFKTDRWSFSQQLFRKFHSALCSLKRSEYFCQATRVYMRYTNSEPKS